MSKQFFTESSFAIDIIADVYKTNDPIEIVEKCKDILDITLTIGEVLDYLCHTEDYESESNKVTMKRFFNEYS